jgi:hypothetical protein
MIIDCNLFCVLTLKVDAIVEAKLKMTDVGCALTLCSLIHQRYAEFSTLFLEGWHKVLLSKKDDKVSRGYFSAVSHFYVKKRDKYLAMNTDGMKLV